MNRLTMILAGLAMSLGLMAQTQPAGEGTEENPYLIGTADELIWFRQEVNGNNGDRNLTACAKLMADIDLNNVHWAGIGSLTYPYQGTFDGDGHLIDKANMNNSSVNYDNVGFFSVIRSATIKNLKIKGTATSGYIAGGSTPMYCGILVGKAEISTISGITVSGTVNSQYGNYVGGIVGGFSKRKSSDLEIVSHMENSVNYATVTGGNYVGGIIGDAASAITNIERCANHGNVTSHDNGQTYVAGITSRTRGKIINCANYGRVNDSSSKDVSYAGGITAQMQAVSDVRYSSTIMGCYNEGQLSTQNANAIQGLIVGTRSSADGIAILSNNIASGLAYNTTTSTESYPLIENQVTYEGIEYRTASQLTDGEACFILQADQEVDAWGQQIGSDAKPLLCLGAPRVYRTGSTVNCIGWALTDVRYANTRDAEVSVGHDINDSGVCTVCGYESELRQDDEGYYLVGNATHYSKLKALIAALANNVACDFKVRQTADIDLSDIAGYHNLASTTHKWSGIYDGQGYKILNARFDRDGLVNTINGGTIKDVHIYGTLINASYSGMISSYVENGATITGCSTHGTISGTGNYVSAILARCTGTSDVIISECANYADITTTGSYVGGIIATNFNSPIAVLKNCANYGHITGSDYVGGLIGYGSNATDESCLSAGDITITSSNTHWGVYVGSYSNSSGTQFPNCVVNPNLTITRNGSSMTYSEYKTSVTEATVGLATGKAAMTLDNGQGVWGQKIGEDDMPSLGAPTVYLKVHHHCDGTEVNGEAEYTNVEGEWVDAHTFSDEGICSLCGSYEPAEQDVDGWYLIYNAGNMRWWGDLVNRTLVVNGISARQMADIDLSSICHAANAAKGISAVSWELIGWTQVWYGAYDGQNHKITGLYCRPEGNAAALFSVVGSQYYTTDYNQSASSVLKNMDVTGTIEVVSSETASGLCGASIICIAKYGGKIENCISRGTIQTNDYSAGGIVASARMCQITNCTNYATITQNCSFDTNYGRIGGIAGNNSGTIDHCANYGQITLYSESERTQYGGIVGNCGGNDGYGDLEGFEYKPYGISYCANYALVIGSTKTGGICGRYTGTKPIHSCFNYGQVRSNAPSTTDVSTRGPIVGEVTKADVELTSLYYRYANTYTQSPIIGTSATTAEVKSGKVANLLGEPWGQNIDLGGTADTYPVLNGTKVYYTLGAYSNILRDRNADNKVTIADVPEAIREKADINVDGEFNQNDLDLIIDKLLEKTAE